jgi:hypothetical protein
MLIHREIIHLSGRSGHTLPVAAVPQPTLAFRDSFLRRCLGCRYSKSHRHACGSCLLSVWPVPHHLTSGHHGGKTQARFERASETTLL